jgi:glycosyltransferase involved in cell wall biosynthesis
MRILALYPFLPYPVVSGAAQRGFYVLDILASKHEVTLISFVGRDDSPSELPFWKSYSLFAQRPITVPRQTEEKLSPEGKRLRALRQRSRVRVPEGLTFFDTPAMWNRIAELDIGQFDAVHVRFAGMTPYALALKQAAPHLRLVVDLDDNPSLLLYRRLIDSMKKLHLRTFVWQLKELLRTFAFELDELRKFDSVWVCSDVDSSRMSYRIGPDRIKVVENIVDAHNLASINRYNSEPAVLMIASFDYDPNKTGAEFFVAKVWPRIRSVIPEAQLWLVGKNSQSRIQEWSGKQGILVTGMVDDVRPYLERAMISVAPIFVGTGTKLKILEALGAGLPVVTTTIGVEGIEARNGVNLLIANTSENFAEHCIRLLTDQTLRDQFAASGKGLIREKYDLPVMSRRILESYETFGCGLGRGDREQRSGVPGGEGAAVPL